MYLKFSRLKLSAQVIGSKDVGTDISFVGGCNIILTDSNTQGKSTLINSLAVGLGFDDLVNKNISALVNDKIRVDGKETSILSADINLEIYNENQEYLSIKRQVNPDFSDGVRVFRGKIADWNEDSVEEYYIGNGSYIGDKGFHNFLCKFVNFPEINVASQDDDMTRLYMQYIFSALFIEQKRGWTDIMSNAPYYRVKDPKKSTISEILGMEYLPNNLERNKLKNELLKLKPLYENAMDTLVNMVHSKDFKIGGISRDVDSKTWAPRIYKDHENNSEISINDYIEIKKVLLSEKGQLEVKHDQIESKDLLEKRVREVSNNITELVSKRDELLKEINLNNNSLIRYGERLKELDKDLKSNKEENRIAELFNKDKWSVSDSCPVCEQKIDKTLLSQVRNFPTMSVDENIKYLHDQIVVLKNIISIEKAKLENDQMSLKGMDNDLSKLFAEHSAIQKSLSGSIPSELMAHAREIAILELEINGLDELKENTGAYLEKIKAIYDLYHQYSQRLKKIKTGLSYKDSQLLSKFETSYKEYLDSLGYSSFDLSNIIIDRDTFLPRVMVQTIGEARKIKADSGSSASDTIRNITSFVLALQKCRSNSNESIHPNVSIFDEPRQQNMDLQHHLSFYEIISDLAKHGGQIIVASTDDEHAIRSKIKQLGLNIIDFGADDVLQ